jgi:hypothetical protein
MSDNAEAVPLQLLGGRPPAVVGGSGDAGEARTRRGSANTLSGVD